MNLKRRKRNEIGKLGEQLAVHYLSGYLAERSGRIVELNWRCRTGELDIIAIEEDCWLFIEVRTRTDICRQGLAIESVPANKQRQVRAVANMYRTAYRLHEERGRFDVIAVTLRKDGSLLHLQHVQDAF